MFGVRVTKSGVTRNVVMLTAEGARSKAIRHASFGDGDNIDLVDVNYYTNSVRSCLRSVCKCIGLPDEDIVVTAIFALEALYDLTDLSSIVFIISIL